MKVAMETTLFARLPLKGALEQIERCGISDVELGLSHFDACKATRGEVTRLKNLLSMHGLRLSALFALGGWNPKAWKKASLGISSPKERDRAEAVAEMENAIETANALDCNLLLSELTGDMDRPAESLRAFTKSIEELLPALAENDTKLCFEAHPGDFIEDSYKAVKLLSSFGAEQIKYNYCVAHTFVLRHKPKEIVSNAKDIIGYIHLADTLKPEKIFFCPTYTPRVIPHLHLIPGLGDVDFSEVIDSLKRIDFEGYLSIHPISHMDNPTEAANQTKKRLDRLLRSSRSAPSKK